MELTPWYLEYYVAPNGRCPVCEYIDALAPRDVAAVTYDLDLLEAFGTALGAPFTKHIKDKIWELRTRASRQHRILYFAARGRRLVLLHAFTKKTRKTPSRELKTALRRLEDFERRNNQ